MSLVEFIESYMREDSQICVISEKSMNILYSGSAGDCFFRLAKSVNFVTFYPYLVNDEQIGIVVSLSPEYYEWRNKLKSDHDYERCSENLVL